MASYLQVQEPYHVTEATQCTGANYRNSDGQIPAYLRKIPNASGNDRFLLSQGKSSLPSLLFLFFVSTCLEHILLSSLNWPARSPLFFLLLFTDHPKSLMKYLSV